LKTETLIVRVDGGIDGCYGRGGDKLILIIRVLLQKGYVVVGAE